MIDEPAIRAQARQFMRGLDLSQVDGDLSVYTKKVNARLSKEDLGESESGYTLTKRDGKSSIVVNEIERLERQRFTICHEVAHLALSLKSNHQETPSWSYAKRDDNEIACDIFASELLMPFDAFKRDVDQEHPSFDLIERLRRKYVVSFSACGSRLAAVTDFPCAFILMNSSVIRYASRSATLRQLNAWIEMRTPVPTGAVAHRLIEEGSAIGESDGISQDIWFRDWPQGYELTELAKHYAAYDETFSLIWFEQDCGPDEPVRNYSGVPTEIDHGGLTELDGILGFPKKTKRK